jgi:FlaA1/EpsC-like NDP-sugar epimerase
MWNLRRAAQIAVDLAILSFSLIAAYFLRYDFAVPFQVIKQMAFQLPYVVILEFFLLLVLGAHRVVWRFVSAADIILLARPLLIAAAVLGLLRAAAPNLGLAHRIYLVVPGGVILINLMLATLGVLGARIGWRLHTEESDRKKITRAHTERRLLIIGAGLSGVQVAKEVDRRPDLGFKLIGFVDDNPNKQKTRIAGYPVMGTLSELDRLLGRYQIDEAVIAITEAKGNLIRQLFTVCEQQSVRVKIIPGLYEIIGGQVSFSRLREVSIEDLLGRDAVNLDTQQMKEFLTQKDVVVTGAGGSIGSELCRQVAEFHPKRLVLVERAEPALFNIHQELKKNFPSLPIEPRIADVTDKDRMRAVLNEGCDVLFHAAAHKHVPMMEWNPTEAIRNNVLGTKCLVDLAAELKIGHFVLISTDKAINPTSIMGASKRAAELYVQAMGLANKVTRFTSVRFGNVLGSAGSVVPIFKKQIAEGGPVTVTHPDMVRYFMTIPEASQLVMQAATLGKGGEVFILDMGEPVKIVDLARDMIRLSGLRPDEDIKIEFTGVRPGEKLFEELSTNDEEADKTTHEKIFVGRVKEHPLPLVETTFLELEAALSHTDSRQIYDGLRVLIPEFAGKPE